ncbi:hypothetical protein BES08_10885 [Novosphingobium resinovorum]|uniref:Uncharacterized protein n=1 Tax=Novosphingobium resinovorum TaxID=158500 RepID=A0A1D8A516_9SPHN|nr:hypothetical protein BES08_10885 [Novosphingobium resinovorum]
MSAIAAFAVINDNRALAKRRGTMDLILHQESDRELVDARTEFNKIKAGDVRPSTYGKSDRINDKEAQYIRRVLNVHELTAVAIQQGVIDECVYRTWFNTTYIKDYEAMKDYIVQARITYGNPCAFSEFEATAIRWKEDRAWGAPPSIIKRKWKALKGIFTA